EEQAKAKWSEVENRYQRRSDLIPDLIETVKGSAKQEREVLQAVTEARSRATTIQATADLSTIRTPSRNSRVRSSSSPARRAACSPCRNAIPTSSRTRTSSPCR